MFKIITKVMIKQSITEVGYVVIVFVRVGAFCEGFY